MSRYYRVSLGKGASFLDDALQHSYIGTGWMPDEDLTGRVDPEWREFNARFIPVVKASEGTASNITAGLACGMTWTVARGIEEGDVVITPTGRGGYRVARVTGSYAYQPGTDLPHRRPVTWLPQEISREAMSDALKSTLRSPGTVVAIREEFVPEIVDLLGSVEPGGRPPASAEVEDLVSFALEKHLEDFLVANWASTELGRDYDIFTDEDGAQIGQQYQTDTGPLDILAHSKDGSELLVVELKRGKVSDAVVGQILRYMGYVKDLDTSKKVRGVIIGLDDDKRLIRALSMVPSISFMRYEVKFRLIPSHEADA